MSGVELSTAVVLHESGRDGFFDLIPVNSDIHSFTDQPEMEPNFAPVVANADHLLISEDCLNGVNGHYALRTALQVGARITAFTTDYKPLEGTDEPYFMADLLQLSQSADAQVRLLKFQREAIAAEDLIEQMPVDPVTARKAFLEGVRFWSQTVQSQTGSENQPKTKLLEGEE